MPRLRDFGVAVGALDPGPLNAITDVAGVRVGHTTLVSGGGALRVGAGPVRTGVTVVQPRPGLVRERPCFAGAATLNGNGEVTGLEWVRESGLLTTPVALTNTYSVGVVRDALAAYDTATSPDTGYWSLPVVGETCDDRLNDIRGQHVRAQHVEQALAAAVGGPVVEGAVGAGTGTVCHGFKGGIGTSSRRLTDADGGWTVGVLVQTNHGTRATLTVAGVPVGRLIPTSEVPAPPRPGARGAGLPPGAGSVVVVVATDAPLLPDQCRRLAVRTGLGLARAGGGVSDSSGDLMICFATGNETVPAERYGPATPSTFAVSSVPHQRLDGLLVAAADATEEAVVNSLLAADDVEGADGVVAHRLPHDRLRVILGEHLHGG